MGEAVRKTNRIHTWEYSESKNMNAEIPLNRKGGLYINTYKKSDCILLLFSVRLKALPPIDGEDYHGLHTTHCVMQSTWKSPKHGG